MFSGKHSTEDYELRLWLTHPEIFKDLKVEEIGGSFQNHYSFLS